MVNISSRDDNDEDDKDDIRDPEDGVSFPGLDNDEDDKDDIRDPEDGVSFPGLDNDTEPEQELVNDNTEKLVMPESGDNHSEFSSDEHLVSDIANSEPEEVSLDDGIDDQPLTDNEEPQWLEEPDIDYYPGDYDTSDSVADIDDDYIHEDDGNGYLPGYDPTVSDNPVTAVKGDDNKKDSRFSTPVIITGVVALAGLIAAGAFVLLPGSGSDNDSALPSLTITSEPGQDNLLDGVTNTTDLVPPAIPTGESESPSTADTRSEERIRDLEERLEKAIDRAESAEREKDNERSPVVRTTTVTSRGEAETITSTVRGSERVVTRTVPGAERTVTRNVPGPERVVTREVPGPTRTVTSTVPGGRVTVTTTIIERLR